MKLLGIGDMLTVAGAAKALGVSNKRMWLWIRRHNVYTAQLGRTLLVHLSDVEQFEKELQNAKQPTTAA